MRRTLFTAALFLFLAAACRPDKSAPPSEPAPPAVSPSSISPPSASRPAESGALVVFLGDSLTAGRGVDADQAYPALVEARLRKDGMPVRVINAGVSGDTTAGGLARLGWLLSQKPDVVVLGLGGNDGLRGLPLEEAEQNLRQIVQRCRAAGARVLLLGMQIPTNYGPEYTRGFREIYPRIAKDLDVPLVPFLLQGVGGVEELNQADGLHPTPEGQEKMAETVAPYLENVLAR